MTQPENETGDDLWHDFDRAEATAEQQLDEGYAKIARYNRRMLNEVAGVQDPDMNYQGPISESATEPVGLSFEHPTNALLYLQPDARRELIAAGEYERADREGDPYFIVGDVPERTQRLIKDMLEGIEAVPVETPHDKDAAKEWIGNIAGVSIRVALYQQWFRSSGEKETRYPKTWLNAFSIDEETSPLDETSEIAPDTLNVEEARKKRFTGKMGTALGRIFKRPK